MSAKMVSGENLDTLKARNRVQSLFEWRTGVTEPKSLPRAVFVELTQGCNLKCPMCRSYHIRPSQRRMSDQVFEAVSRELFPAAELVDLRGWGESLILPDIAKRIDAVAEYQAKLRVVSNFSFNRDNVLDQLAEVKAIVDVSIDTACPETLMRVRGGAKLDLIERNLRYLLQKGRMQGNVCLLVTIQRETIAHLPALVDFAARVGVQRMRLFPVTVGEGSPLALSGLDQQIDCALSEATTRAKANHIRLEAGGRLGTIDGDMGDNPCIHPWSYCYISYRGDIGFCDHLIGAGNESYLVGNIIDDDFGLVWRGPNMTTLRLEHLNARRAAAPLFAHCAWCYKNKFTDFEDVFAPEARASQVVLA